MDKKRILLLDDDVDRTAKILELFDPDYFLTKFFSIDARASESIYKNIINASFKPDVVLASIDLAYTPQKIFETVHSLAKKYPQVPIIGYSHYTSIYGINDVRKYGFTRVENTLKGFESLASYVREDISRLSVVGVGTLELPIRADISLFSKN